VAAATAALLAVLGGLAYGIDALISSGGSTQVARAPSGPGSPMWWLGMEIESFPNGGAVIVTVPAGSLGEVAGLDPGDVILQVGNRIVNSSSDIAKAVVGMRVGHVVEIKVSRGSTLFTTRAILGAAPSNSP
jgi:S1-C subfamily serine protease